MCGIFLAWSHGDKIRKDALDLFVRNRRRINSNTETLNAVASRALFHVAGLAVQMRIGGQVLENDVPAQDVRRTVKSRKRINLQLHSGFGHRRELHRHRGLPKRGRC